ncbi:glycosyltransferase family 2 protein [Pseudalkalibacillus hwajinpoensis]|uniref:glycosyltransferase family 2 protein n=1 Tax=Guptibacillus hwajinpoensis TaxID=208199 RepID=UPI00325AD322
MKQDVTVLIPSFNPGSYLAQAIESVFQQTYQSWKVVIVDDGSNDNSLFTIKHYLMDPRVILIKMKKNYGQSKAQNAGLKMINTPYTLKLDADDWLFPNSLEVLLQEVQNVSNKVALICGNKTDVYCDENGNKLIEVPRREGITFENPYQFLLSNFVPFPRLYRTKVLKELGGWPTDDPWQGRHMEDRRMDFLIVEKYEIKWIDKMLYNYRQHPNNATKNIELYNQVFEWLIYYTLKKWGDEYEPQFKTHCGWRQLSELRLKKS